MDDFELDPIPDSPDEDANKALLESKLQEYHKAMEQEFSTGVKYLDGTLTPSEIRDRSKEILTQAVPKAVARLKYLAEFGENESIQFKAATYIIEKAIGKEVGGMVGDPLEELLRGIAPKEPAPSN